MSSLNKSLIPSFIISSSIITGFVFCALLISRSEITVVIKSVPEQFPYAESFDEFARVIKEVQRFQVIPNPGYRQQTSIGPYKTTPLILFDSSTGRTFTHGETLDEWQITPKIKKRGIISEEDYLGGNTLWNFRDNYKNYRLDRFDFSDKLYWSNVSAFDWTPKPWYKKPKSKK